MTIEQILKAEEGQTFDRKSLKIAPKDLANTIVAFANSDGGIIVIGVSDSTKRIEGVDHDYDKSKLNDILRVPLDFCIPSVPVRTEWVDCIDYKNRENRLLVFHIEPSSKLHTNQADDAYLRVGDKSMKLSFYDRLQLMYDKGLMLFEETIVDNATLDDIDMEAVTDYCDTIGYGKSVKEFLIESKGYIVERKGIPTPTVASILLFGKQPQQFFPYAKIRFIRYSDTEEKTGSEMNVIKDVEFKGTIKQQIDKAVEYLGTQISEHTYLGSNGLFVTDDEYPAFVRQELIVNAACHRDYSIHGTDTHVKMFTNRLTVESPGNLPGRVRPDNIRHTHFSRNPKIAQFLKAYNYVKEFGEGVDRMCRELEAVDCGDVKFFPYGFMLRTTVMNRVGHAQIYNGGLESSLMNDSLDNEQLNISKVILSSQSDTLEETKVIHLSQSDTYGESKMTHSSKGDIIETESCVPHTNSSLKSKYADFSNKEYNIKSLEKILERGKFNQPTKTNLITLYSIVANNEIFGRKEVVAILGCSIPTGARIISTLKELDLIFPIKGNGKGRYMFKNISE